MPVRLPNFERRCSNRLSGLGVVVTTVYREESNSSPSPGWVRMLVPWETLSRMDPSLLKNAGEQTTRNLSIFAPVSPPAESIRNLSILVFAITGFIFLVVEGVLLYCIVRSRRRAAWRDDRTASGLRQQADRDRLDGGTCLDRFHPHAGHGPIALGGQHRTAGHAAGQRSIALRHRGRPPMVVGIHVRILQRQEARLHHGQ